MCMRKVGERIFLTSRHEISTGGLGVAANLHHCSSKFVFLVLMPFPRTTCEHLFVILYLVDN